MRVARYFFPRFFKNFDADNVFEAAVKNRNEGKLQEALQMCEKLVNEYPYNVYYRRELVMLQRALGLDIHLPDITPKNVR